MSYRHTIQATLDSLHEIEDLIKEFPGNGTISAVDIDLTLQKIRNIYELMLMMKKESDVSARDKEVAAANTPRHEPNTDVPTDTAASTPKPGKVNKDAQTLADQFKGSPTLHESLHQTYLKDETLAHGKPVTNLMEAIGINDRYTFIRELFNGEAAKYESSMKFLNDAASFNDAYNYMILYFNWDMDSEAVKLLLDIIRRKFIKGRNE